MIDLHCHIIPGVDDGAQAINESLQIAHQLYKAGFKTIFATPHVLEGRDYLTPQEILHGVDKVNSAIQEEGLDLQIIPGAECYIFPDLPRWVREDKIMTMGNKKKYILIELPMLEVPTYTEKVFFDLQVMGITPILAHPERNKELAAKPVRLVEWAKKGVLLQLDLRSIDGRYGEKVSQFAHLLSTSKLIHFIGSDAHRVARENTYQNSLQMVMHTVGREEYREITTVLPSKVLDGETLSIDRSYSMAQPNKSKTSGFWSRLFAVNPLKSQKPHGM